MRNNLLLILFGLVLGLFLSEQWGCKSSSKSDLVNIDTVTVTKIETRIDTIIEYKTIKIKEKGQLASTAENFSKDSIKNVFTYTKQVNDTSSDGELFGTLNVSTLGDNFIGYSFDWEFEKDLKFVDTTLNTFTNTNTTTTITQERKKNLFYLGSSIGFARGAIQDVNVNASLKFKNDKIIYYEAGQNLQLATDPFLIHRVGFKVPIVLFKK